MIGKLICWITRKHKRGKLVGRNIGANDGTSTYRCPRCNASWTRKAKAAA